MMFSLTLYHSSIFCISLVFCWANAGEFDSIINPVEQNNRPLPDVCRPAPTITAFQIVYGLVHMMKGAFIGAVSCASDAGSLSRNSTGMSST